MPAHATANKRICVVLTVDDLGYGGAERQVVELANNMDVDRFDVHVCALSDHVPLASTLKDAEHRLHIVVRRHRFDVVAVLRLARLLRTLQADIAHGFLFSGEMASRLAGRLAGTKVVIGSERNANQVMPRNNVIAYRLTQRLVDVIIANSHTGAESNRRVFGRAPSDYRVVHNGVDIERFKPAERNAIRDQLGIPLLCPVIGVFAAFRKQKNHPMLFRAFKQVLESFPDARLLIVGDQPVNGRSRYDDYTTRLHQTVDELGIRHRCVFLGHQESPENLYAACDITALSSLHEGTPNVLLESMACGVPVVATNVCDNAYIVREGEVGHLVAVGDEMEMADRMKVLLEETARRMEMGRRARSWVVEEFSGRQLACKTEAVYIELLGR